jgi:hypothetical protein
MCRDENDRETDVSVGELSLELEATAAGQPDIEHKAGGTLRAVRLKEFVYRSH